MLIGADIDPTHLGSSQTQSRRLQGKGMHVQGVSTGQHDFKQPQCASTAQSATHRCTGRADSGSSNPCWRTQHKGVPTPAARNPVAVRHMPRKEEGATVQDTANVMGTRWGDRKQHGSCDMQALTASSTPLGRLGPAAGLARPRRACVIAGRVVYSRCCPSAIR